MNRLISRTKNLSIFFMALLWSLTVFGEHTIKPTSREIKGKDTLTTFTIASERLIVYRLRQGQILEQRVKVQDTIIQKQGSVIHCLDTLVEFQKKEIITQGNFLNLRGDRITTLELGLSKEKKRNYRLRTYSRILTGVSVILACSLVFK